MNSKEVLKILTGRHSIITSITILLVLDFILIASLIVPWLLPFIIEKHIFEIVVLTALVEVLLLLSSNLWYKTPSAIGSEEEVQEKVRSLLEDDTTIKSIKVLSAGLRSRAGFLRALLELPRKLNLEIVACFGEANPDKLDREKFGPAYFDVITHRLDQDAASRLKIYNSFNTPSFRCILLSDSHGPHYGILGWYTYHERNTQMIGRRNIQIFVDRSTETGFVLLNFADKMFQKYANEKEAVIIWPNNQNIVSKHENSE